MCLKNKMIKTPQRNVHVLRHVKFEGLGNIGKYLMNNNLKYNETRLFNNERLPEIINFELLIIMGGPMGIYDDTEYPWLIEERIFIKKVIQKGIKIIGICLGAQLLADSLGGQVYKGPYKEIGWFKVMFHQEFYDWMIINSKQKLIMLTPEAVFHWHGDTFTNPPGSINVGITESGINQGFIYNNQILGLQFHLEMTSETVDAIVKNGIGELTELAQNNKYIQNEKSMISEMTYHVSNYNFLCDLLDVFLCQ